MERFVGLHVIYVWLNFLTHLLSSLFLNDFS